jgi:hypothetical protein
MNELHISLGLEGRWEETEPMLSIASIIAKKVNRDSVSLWAPIVEVLQVQNAPYEPELANFPNYRLQDSSIASEH